jgi:hypothetical protein
MELSIASDPYHGKELKIKLKRLLCLWTRDIKEPLAREGLQDPPGRAGR